MCRDKDKFKFIKGEKVMNYQNQNNHLQNQYRNFSSYQASQNIAYNFDIIDKRIGSADFFQALERELPPVFTRKVASNVIGGILSVKTLSNLDSLGKGVKGAVRIGNKVCYKREAFIEWLKNRRIY